MVTGLRLIGVAADLNQRLSFCFWKNPTRTRTTSFIAAQRLWLPGRRAGTHLKLFLDVGWTLVIAFAFAVMVTVAAFLVEGRRT